MRRQAGKTQMIHARVDPKLKRSAERVFSQIGISFPVRIPNEETVAAMKEANDPATLRRYGSFRELREKV
jgi:antitoxin component of RelBE/YafQ-DinJ toxin-antitoxin module